MKAIQESSVSERPARRLRYFLPLASVAGASVFAFAALPQQMGGLISLPTVLLLILIDRSTRRTIDARPRGTKAILYFVLTAIVYVGSLIVAVAIARDEPLWVAGSLAVVVFVVVALGAWVPNRRRAHQVNPSEPGLS